MIDDIHRLIFDFAYAKKNITPKRFNEECVLIKQAKHCIPQYFFRSVVHSNIEKELVSNPYREFMPYIPLASIQKRSIFEPLVAEILWGLSTRFFTRMHSYRSTFRRYVYRLNCFGLKNHWNKIFLKYLVYITPADFDTPTKDDLGLVEALEDADCF